MSKQRNLITTSELLTIANQALKEHDGCFEGVRVYAVTQTPETLIFKGESFLDSDGLPTLQSTAAFNLYKWLSLRYKDQYQLQA